MRHASKYATSSLCFDSGHRRYGVLQRYLGVMVALAILSLALRPYLPHDCPHHAAMSVADVPSAFVPENSAVPAGHREHMANDQASMAHGAAIKHGHHSGHTAGHTNHGTIAQPCPLTPVPASSSEDPNGCNCVERKRVIAFLQADQPAIAESYSVLAFTVKTAQVHVITEKAVWHGHTDTLLPPIHGPPVA